MKVRNTRTARDRNGMVRARVRLGEYKREANGVKLQKTEVYGDPRAAMVAMLKRGMLKPEQLMG